MRDTTICRVLHSTLLVLLFCCAVILGQPEVRGQSSDLQTTMKSLQDKMSNLGAFYSTAYFTNDAGRTRQVQKVFEITSFDADATACHISYSLTNPNKVDSEFSFDLKDVGRIEVMTSEEKYQEIAIKGGHPNSTQTTDPTEYVVDVILNSLNQDFMFYFADHDEANSVAEAMRRAARLCGGQTDQPPGTGYVGESSQEVQGSSNAQNSNVTVYNNTNESRLNSQGPQYVRGLSQCTRTQYENQGGTLWIVNNCNVPVTVQLTSDSGNTWGQVDVSPNNRAAASMMGMGYNPRKDGTVYLFTCPKGSQPVLPNGSFFLARNYKGQFTCAQQ
jgi:hypothetical protein